MLQQNVNLSCIRVQHVLFLISNYIYYGCQAKWTNCKILKGYTKDYSVHIMQSTILIESTLNETTTAW